MNLPTFHLPNWMWSKHYKDRHPHGVIYKDAEGFRGIFRSYKTPETALSAAAQLNKTHTQMLKQADIFNLTFEAVTFIQK